MNKRGDNNKKTGKTTIIAADYMYLIFLGTNVSIDKIINKLNNTYDKKINIKQITVTNRNNNDTSSECSNDDFINDILQPEMVDKNALIPIKTKTDEQRKNIYMKCNINEPCINILDGDIIDNIISNFSSTDKEYDKKYVVLDEGVESAHCLTYADISTKEMKTHYKIKNISNIVMMMVLISNDTHYKLSFPSLELEEEENSDVMIRTWMEKNKIDSLVRQLTLKPINIVGNEHDILVFTAFIIDD